MSGDDDLPSMDLPMFMELSSHKHEMLTMFESIKLEDWLDEEEQIAYIMDVVEASKHPFKNLLRVWITRYVKERMQK